MREGVKRTEPVWDEVSRSSREACLHRTVALVTGPFLLLSYVWGMVCSTSCDDDDKDGAEQSREHGPSSLTSSTSAPRPAWIPGKPCSVFRIPYPLYTSTTNQPSGSFVLMWFLFQSLSRFNRVVCSTTVTLRQSVCLAFCQPLSAGRKQGIVPFRTILPTPVSKCRRRKKKKTVNRIHGIMF